jgi:hypothetical protein
MVRGCYVGLSCNIMPFTSARMVNTTIEEFILPNQMCSYFCVPSLRGELTRSCILSLESKVCGFDLNCIWKEILNLIVNLVIHNKVLFQ